jgi:two-component system sensor histidine kinase ChiS
VKKILVVEDDPVNLQILSDFLGAHGYDMRAAATGPEGVARFHSEHPDLMLVDIQLPRKNGFEVCWEIKRTPEGKDMPVLLMSAVYTPRDEQDQLAAPSLAAGFLAKPFDLGDLLSRVKRLIGEATASA